MVSHGGTGRSIFHRFSPCHAYARTWRSAILELTSSLGIAVLGLMLSAVCCLGLPSSSWPGKRTTTRADTGISAADASGHVLAWGLNNSGQCTPPSPNEGFIAVDAGLDHVLGLKSDGSIVAWGNNSYGKCDVPTPNSGYTAISAGEHHSLALKSDGSLVAWGYNYYHQCDVPLPNTGFISVSAGYYHSLALKSDGSIVAWGSNSYGVLQIPSPNTGFVAVSAGINHSLALKSDGSVVAWGYNGFGQCDVPSPNSGFIAVSAGYNYSVGLKSDGSVVMWGNVYTFGSVPAPNAGYVAISAGYGHCLALRADGSVVSWGRNDYGERQVPPGCYAFAVSAGDRFSIALTSVYSTWFLAEGSTDGGMETWVLVQNPNDFPVSVDLTLMTGQGALNPPQLQGQLLNPQSRRSFPLHVYITTYDLSTLVKSYDGAVICERAMYGPGRVWAHDSIGVTEPAYTWYLAEGSTDGGMETWVLVQNPNSYPVEVSVDFQTQSGYLEGPREEIPPRTRRSYEVAKYVRTYNVSTRVTSTTGMVVCERAMYGNNRRWAHDSVGATELGEGWILAEGATAGDMETWVLVQNPTSYYVGMEMYFLADGQVIEGPYETIPPHTRRSYPVDQYVSSFNVSTVVFTADGSACLVCERAMYGGNRTWGHDSVGVTYSANFWCLPEGCTDGGFETWVLACNPYDEPTAVEMLFMTDKGPVKGPSFTMGPFSRRSIFVGDYVKTYDVSTFVIADKPNIVCERAVYWGNRTCGHESIGFFPEESSEADVAAARAGSGLSVERIRKAFSAWLP